MPLAATTSVLLQPPSLYSRSCLRNRNRNRNHNHSSSFPVSISLYNKAAQTNRQNHVPLLLLQIQSPRCCVHSPSESSQQWDSLTARFSAAASAPLLVLQMPQILMNARNLMTANKGALLAVAWLSILTGLLGNLSLLSYFVKKRENEVIVAQTIGVVSRYVVLAQLAIADAMPFPFFLLITTVVSAGILLNFLNYFRLLRHPSPLWLFWEDFITVGSLSVLPQVMWSTFVPYLPDTLLPGAFSCHVVLAAVVLARTGRLSEKGVEFVGAISGWAATLLFMWMPVSQMWTNLINPANIKGLSAFSMLLAMIGNGLMIPRALFTRDFMWFIGTFWTSFFYGYGNILSLYRFNAISKEFFWATTAGLFLWVVMTLWKDTEVHGYSSPLASFRELVFGAKVLKD